MDVCNDSIRKMLSVVVPIYNEENYIAGCIDSILAQEFSHAELEIVLVDGMSRDRTREIIAAYIRKYPFIRMVDNPRRFVPYAMNIGIEKARGDVIMRLDAHATYEKNYFSVLSSALWTYDVDNVGAVCKTDVLSKTPKTLAIREVLSHRFGVGNSLFRTGIKGAQEVDTVPFGCWKRETFDKYGLFDVRLVRNQDIELNKRIRRGGGKVLIVPDTFSTYFARETFTELARNNYKNGQWNVLTVYYTKDFSSLSVRHFVPLAFVLGLLLPLLLGVCWPPTCVLSFAVLLSYLLTLGCISARLALLKGLNLFYLLASFATLHVSYGCGSLTALFRLPFMKH